jgi:hypothetical protein
VKLQTGPVRLFPLLLVTVIRHSYCVYGARPEIGIDAVDPLGVVVLPAAAKVPPIGKSSVNSLSPSMSKRFSQGE